MYDTKMLNHQKVFNQNPTLQANPQRNEKLKNSVAHSRGKNRVSIDYESAIKTLKMSENGPSVGQF